MRPCREEQNLASPVNSNSIQRAELADEPTDIALDPPQSRSRIVVCRDAPDGLEEDYPACTAVQPPTPWLLRLGLPQDSPLCLQKGKMRTKGYSRLRRLFTNACCTGPCQGHETVPNFVPVGRSD